jgi:hypothetical protein
MLASNQPKLELARLDPTAYRFRWTTALTHLRLRESSRPFTIGLILASLAVNGFIQYLPEINAISLLFLTFAVMAAGLWISRFVIAPLVDRLPPFLPCSSYPASAAACWFCHSVKTAWLPSPYPSMEAWPRP